MSVDWLKVAVWAGTALFCVAAWGLTVLVALKVFG